MSYPPNLGLTKTKANALANAGYEFACITPINKARPALAGIEYRAAPIQEEGTTVFCFKNAHDRKAFIDEYGADLL